MAASRLLWCTSGPGPWGYSGGPRIQNGKMTPGWPTRAWSKNVKPGRVKAARDTQGKLFARFGSILQHAAKLRLYW